MVSQPAWLNTRQPIPAELHLEDGLQEVACAVAELFAHARAIDPAADEYGHARSRAYTDAVALLKAGAKVGHTIAELRGSKFEHTINVRRDGAVTESASAVRQEEEDESPYLWLGHDVLFNWKTKQPYRLVPETFEKIDPDNAAAKAAQAKPSGTAPEQEEGTPNRISEGSNGNSIPPADAAFIARADDAAFAALGPGATLVEGEAAADALGRVLNRVEEAEQTRQTTGALGETPSHISRGSNGNSVGGRTAGTV